jgi:hypothetical protein
MEIRKLEETWADAVFADSAAEVLDFHDLLKREHRKEARKGLVAGYQWISLDLLHRLQQVLASARTKSRSSRIRRRIDLLEKTVAYGCTDEIWRTGPPRKYFGT